MNMKNRFVSIMAVRLLMTLLPLLWGFTSLSFCMCAYNCALIMIGRGPLYGLAAQAYCSLIALAFTAICGSGLEQAASFALELVLASTFCAFAYVTRRSLALTIGATAAAYGLGELVEVGFEAQSEGMSVVGYKFAEFTKLFQTASASDNVAADSMIAYFGDLFARLSPAWMIIASIVAGYAVVWQCEKSLRLTAISKKHSFANLRLDAVGVIFGAIMLLLCIASNDKVAVVAMNGFVVFLFLAFCAGMSLIDFLLRRKLPSVLSRLCVHFLILTVGLLLGGFTPLLNTFLIYMLVGIVDSFVSFRKRAVKKHEQ